MYCSKCGKEIPDDSVFCPECGSQLTKGDNKSLASQSPDSKANTVFPQKDMKSEPLELASISTSSRKTGLLIVVAFGWTMISWFAFLIIGGFIIGAIYPDNAGGLGQHFGETSAIPSLLFFGCLSAILTKFGKLPGTKKN